MSNSKPFAEPLHVLKGNRWFVENQKENKTLIVASNSFSESAFVSACSDSSLSFLNKMNSITISQASRCTFTVSDVISAVEMLHCSNILLIITGKCQSIRLDDCEAVTIKLGDASTSCEIITYKANNVSVCYAASEEKEHRICDYWTSVFDPVKGALTTLPTDSGASS